MTVKTKSPASMSRSSGELSRMMSEGRSFSGNERNCCFLNTAARPGAGGRFANISAVSGLDFPDDGRAVALVDWDLDGDLDIWISNRNAPRLRLMRNDTPTGNGYLALHLVGNGQTTNRDAIGARVEVVIGNQSSVIGKEKQSDGRPGESNDLITDDRNPQSAIRNPQSIKTLRAGEGFLAQSSKWLHFGLGAADAIEKVIVHWPGGETEEFTGIQVDHRYRLVQGLGTGQGPGQDITRPARETKLFPSTQKILPPSQVARIPMVELLTVPRCDFVGFDVGKRPLPIKAGRLVLVNLWSSSCRPCLRELSEFASRYDEIRAKGIEIVALSVDGLGTDASQTAAAARLASGSKFPFTVGKVTPSLVETFQNLHDYQFPIHHRLPLPTSFLIDQQGRLAVIYKGPLSIDELLDDVAHSDGSRHERFAGSAPLAGQPIPHPQVQQTADTQAAILRFLLAAGMQQAGRADQALTQYAEVLKLKPDFAKAHNNLGNALQRMARSEEAIAHYQEALRIKPDNPEAHSNWGNALQSLGRARGGDHALPASLANQAGLRQCS